MTPEQFCYWLQGRAELQPETPPSEEEWAIVVMHLQTVFQKVTPTHITLTPPKLSVESVMRRAQEMQQGSIPPAQC